MPFLLSAQNELQKKLENASTAIREGRLEDAEGILSSVNEENGDISRVRGELYLRQGRLDLAQENFNQSLTFYEKNNLGETDGYASSLNSIAIAYWNAGKYDQAEQNILRALDIRKKLYGDEHELIAASYNDIGLIYSNTNPDRALDNYEKALTVYQKLYKGNHEKIAQANTNTGFIYAKLELYGDAINNLETALDIWRAIYPDGHPNEAFVLSGLGNIYRASNDFNSAQQYYEQALDIYLQSFGPEHPDVANTYNFLGNVHMDQGDFQLGLENFQKAIEANVPNFNSSDVEQLPSIDIYYNANTLINSLLYKSRAFEARYYGKTLKFSELEQALASLEQCDKLIDKVRRVLSNENDKIALGAIAEQVYEEGIKIAYTMGDVAFKKKPHYERAFYFSEKSKSAVLLESIADADAKSFANLPVSILDQEKELKSEIAFIEQRLAAKPGVEEEQKFRQRLLELNRNYEAFTTELEQKYPEYFNLKFNTQIPSIDDIQQKLDDKTAVVSYFISEGASRVYIFYVTKKDFKVKNLSQRVDFNRYITGLRNSILYQSPEVFNEAASNLYKQLFAGRLSSTIEKLVLVPTGRLGTIPFETLITKKLKEEEADFDKFDYLIEKYAFSYAYSATLFYQGQTSDNSTSKLSSILLCAPVNFEEEDIILPSLPGTAREVETIKQSFSAKGLTAMDFTYEKATEDLIKSDRIADYQYLHFATHGTVDEENQELSRIFLSKDAKGSEDGNLFAGEIYNLNMNADLVTLSACETGLGKISKGEGIIGLTRALVFAGASNIMVSLWTVADESTSDLMIDFYGRILNKSMYGNYSQPLRETKLNMIREGKYSSPYYWAPFVLIGE